MFLKERREFFGIEKAGMRIERVEGALDRRLYKSARIERSTGDIIFLYYV